MIIADVVKADGGVISDPPPVNTIQGIHTLPTLLSSVRSRDTYLVWNFMDNQFYKLHEQGNQPSVRYDQLRVRIVNI